MGHNNLQPRWQPHVLAYRTVLHSFYRSEPPDFCNQTGSSLPHSEDSLLVPVNAIIIIYETFMIMMIFVSSLVESIRQLDV